MSDSFWSVHAMLGATLFVLHVHAEHVLVQHPGLIKAPSVEKCPSFVRDGH